MTARLARALRGFTHPRPSGRCSGTSSTPTTRPMLDDIRADLRALAEVLDRFERASFPSGRPSGRSASTPTSPATTPSSTTTGGLRYRRLRGHEPSALAVDFAVGRRFAGERARRRRAVPGRPPGHRRYQRVTRSSPSSSNHGRADRHPVRGHDRDPGVASGRGLEEPSSPSAYTPRRRSFGRSSTPAGTRRRGGSGRPPAGGRPAGRDLIDRRAGPGPGAGTAHLRASDPLASAQGVWMTDTDGRGYLDAYNNVP